MRFGVILMPVDSWPESVAAARRVEALGYDHLWVYDHLTWRRYRDQPWHGIYPWLTGIAASTDRIGVGTMVSSPNIRHPVTLAKDAMTIDHISNGRLTIGVGAGGVGFDATAFGQDLLSPGQRIDRLEEFVSVVDGLLRGSLTDHQGPWYTVSEARMIPGCIQSPRLPVAIAAGKHRGIELAAAAGDAWITNGDTSIGDLTLAKHWEIVGRQVDMFDAACEQIGRHRADIGRILMISNGEGRPLSSTEAFDEFVTQAAESGFTDIVFHHPRPDDPIWNDPVEVVAEIADRYLEG